MIAPRLFAPIDPDGYYITSSGARSHFHRSEMTCRCGCGADMMDQRQIDMMEAIRTRVGEPVHVNSGVRCWPYHQHVYKIVGKPVTPDSQHLPRTPAGGIIRDSGTQIGGSRATDCTVAGMTPRQFRALVEAEAQRLGAIGIGAYAGFTHVDSRDGAGARWSG